MAYLDHDFARGALSRLRALPQDASPRWGAMNPQQMVCHLNGTFCYVMGRKGEPAERSTWVTRNILGPLILNGLVPIPKNVRVPGTKARVSRDTYEEEVNALQEVIEEYLDLAAGNDFAPYPHPMFGDIGANGWGKMHVRHVEHHLRQFGA